MAERLLASGHSLLGFDIDPERRANLERLGGEAADSSTEIAQRCGRIFLSLPTSDTVDKLLSEIENHFAPKSNIPESIIIDTTTGDPDQISAFGPRLAERGVEYLDATVGGSSQQVRALRFLTKTSRMFFQMSLHWIAAAWQRKSPRRQRMIHSCSAIP